VELRVLKVDCKREIAMKEGRDEIEATAVAASLGETPVMERWLWNVICSQCSLSYFKNGIIFKCLIHFIELLLSEFFPSVDRKLVRGLVFELVTVVTYPKNISSQLNARG
jgi:hypothetical protein